MILDQCLGRWWDQGGGVGAAASGDGGAADGDDGGGNDGEDAEDGVDGVGVGDVEYGEDGGDGVDGEDGGDVEDCGLASAPSSCVIPLLRSGVTAEDAALGECSALRFFAALVRRGDCCWVTAAGMAAASA